MASNDDAVSILALDEGHGFARKDNADYLFYSIVMFLRETMLR